MLTFRAWLEAKYWGKEGAGCIAIARFDKTGNPSGKILIGFRSANVVKPNLCWATFGGAIRGIKGEIEMSPQKGAEREFREETKYAGPIEEMIHVYTDVQSNFQYHNFIAIIPQEFQPILNWENEKSHWFSSWKEIVSATPQHPGFTRMLRAARPIIFDLVRSIRSKSLAS